MGWRTFILGFAAFVAMCLGAWAQSASGSSWPAAQQPSQTAQPENRQIAPVQLPARNPYPIRGSEGTEQPRYATMIPPTQDDLANQPAPLAAQPAPMAAPTQHVQVGPDTAQPQVAQAPAPYQPRYATQAPQLDPRETVQVTGLRQSEDGMYRLGPGDKLRVTVFNEPDLSGEFSIDGQGFVRLPLVGQVQAAGLTSFSLEARIGDAFTNGGFLVNPRVAVEITTYRPFYIIGQVAKPGEYAYVNAMTAPNAIALAGGFTEGAVESEVRIRRQGDPKEREYRVDETTRVYPGDVIRVERSTYWSIMTYLAPIISPFATVAYLLK